MADKEKETTTPETVLILQGGGSLGAYECGVWKTLAKHNIKFEIIAGTSIGAVNAAIIAAHKGSNKRE
jgi:NTE family protein